MHYLDNLRNRTSRVRRTIVKANEEIEKHT